MYIPFASRFAPHAARVRLRLAARGALTMAAGAAAAGVPVATVLWWYGHGTALVALMLPLVGALVGLLAARLSRWSDLDAALFLDARLGAPETFATALSLPADATPAARDTVLLRARDALDALGPEHLPATWRRHHLVLFPAVAFTVAAALLPTPGAHVRAHGVAPAVAPSLRFDAVPGLVAIERLRTVDTRDAARRQRLDALAAQARRLHDALREGTAPERVREALRTLRQGLAEERRAFGAGSEQRGTDRAVETLRDAGLDDAAEALARRDLEALDRAMERAANAREAADRRRAREALQAAAEAAEQAGAPETADTLRDEENLLRRRVERNALLRRLAEQLGRDEFVRRAAEHLDRARSDEAARDLAAAMEQALASLTSAERERLVQRMREAMQRAESGSRAAPDDAASEGAMSAEQLADALRRMANEDDRDGDNDGDENSGRDGTPGGASVPVPGRGSARSIQRALARAETGARQAGAQTGAGDAAGRERERGGGGVSRGGGPGDHDGATAATRGDGMRARVRSAMNPGAAAGATQALAPTPAGAGVARALRTGDLQGAAADELHGVERADIPAEYREQVRVYFQP